MDDDMTVRRVVDADLPPDEVWERVATVAALSTWLGPLDADLVTGAEGRIVLDGVTHHVLVEVVAPPRRLALRWWPIDADAGVGPASEVEISVEPRPDGASRLVVQERRSSRPLGFRASVAQASVAG